MSSAEFTEWIGFWAIEADEMNAGTEREPTREELGGQIFAWAKAHNERYYRSQGLPAPEMKPPGWAGG